MGPTGFAQIAVAAAYRSLPGSDKQPGNCAPSRRSAFAVISMISLL
jgi:hypothetical protein